VFNIVFAWALFVVILISGAPTSITAENAADATNTFVLISNVMENAPAAQAGLIANDIIISASNDTTTFSGETLTVEQVKQVITSASEKVTLEIKRGDEILNIETVPATGIIGEAKALGISMDRIGTLSTPWYRAFGEALTMTWEGLKAVFFGLGHLIASLVGGSANLNSVSGPVGIVDMVGSAAKFGFVNLLAFTAMLSLNLAVLNIMPFPALDGGRLLFLAIEGVIRRRIKPAFANATNAIGFLILIGFMIVVTINDVIKLF
jgi:regulator of sigma E protease